MKLTLNFLVLTERFDLNEFLLTTKSLPNNQSLKILFNGFYYFKTILLYLLGVFLLLVLELFVKYFLLWEGY